MSEIEVLAADVKRLEGELSAARKRLHQAQLDAAPVKVGDVVIYDGKRHRVCGVNPRYSPPWVSGNPERADGTFGTAVRRLFDDWKHA